MRLTGERDTEGEEAPRKRAAVEVVARYEAALRRTARRYSLCAEDAEDAFQRAMEILLTKAPTTDPRELIRWTQTVTKHEALAVRRGRERSMGGRFASPEGVAVDWVALIPATGDGPDEQVERREEIARSREALRALKPAERRALSLLAGGCSYAEIGRITGFSQTKVNRSIAEGRARFRRLLTGSEDGSRCAELQPLLSAFCDGEARPEEAAVLREHLRACGPCRAAMRAYRATPRAVAALAPAPFATGSLFDRAREALADLQARLPGQGGAGDPAMAQVTATGGAKGAGMAALAKGVAVCAGTMGGAAACVAAGVIPAPTGVFAGDAKPPALERRAERPAKTVRVGAGPYGWGWVRRRRPPAHSEPEHREQAAAEAPPAAAQAEPVEYAPPPEAAPAPAPASAPPPEATPPSTSSGSAAGEFGP